MTVRCVTRLGDQPDTGGLQPPVLAGEVSVVVDDYHVAIDFFVQVHVTTASQRRRRGEVSGFAAGVR